MLKVAIIDDNCRLTEFISTQVRIQYSNKYEVIFTAHDGLTAYNLILKHKPDVVLLDMSMPKMDGISMLEELRKTYLYSKTLFIAVTASSSDYITNRAKELGVEYFFIKPFDFDVLLSRITSMYESFISINQTNEFMQFFNSNSDSNSDSGSSSDSGSIINTESNFNSDIPTSAAMSMSFIQSKSHSNTSACDYINFIVNTLKISPNLFGYDYLKTGFKLCLEDNSFCHYITKNLYPEIAKKHNSSSSRVERAIRTSIQKAWRNGAGQEYKNLFNIRGYDESKTPTNGELFKRVTELYNQDKAFL